MERARAILLRILEAVVGLLFMVISAVTLAQVCCRYALGFSLPWSHELVVLLLIWAVWLCVPIGLDRRQHLAVTVVLEHVPERVRAWLDRLNWALALFFVALVFLLSFPVVEAFEGMTLLTLPIPTNARYYAATVGSLLSVLVLVAQQFGGRSEA
jgi:TRAP-type C4-dicarboxylate transport system permease small subunit